MELKDRILHNRKVYVKLLLDRMTEEEAIKKAEEDFPMPEGDDYGKD